MEIGTVICCKWKHVTPYLIRILEFCEYHVTYKLHECKIIWPLCQFHENIILIAKLIHFKNFKINYMKIIAVFESVLFRKKNNFKGTFIKIIVFQGSCPQIKILNTLWITFYKVVSTRQFIFLIWKANNFLIYIFWSKITAIIFPPCKNVCMQVKSFFSPLIFVLFFVCFLPTFYSKGLFF